MVRVGVNADENVSLRGYAFRRRNRRETRLRARGRKFNYRNFCFTRAPRSPALAIHLLLCITPVTLERACARNTAACLCLPAIVPRRCSFPGDIAVKTLDSEIMERHKRAIHKRTIDIATTVSA